MKDHNKKAVVLTADKFEDLEVFFPLFRLLEMGWNIDVAAPKNKSIGGEHGCPLDPTLTIDEVNWDNYDLLIVPGSCPDGAPATVHKMKKQGKSQNRILKRTSS